MERGGGEKAGGGGHGGDRGALHVPVTFTCGEALNFSQTFPVPAYSSTTHFMLTAALLPLPTVLPPPHAYLIFSSTRSGMSFLAPLLVCPSPNLLQHPLRYVLPRPPVELELAAVRHEDVGEAAGAPLQVLLLRTAGTLVELEPQHACEGGGGRVAQGRGK